MKDKNYFTKVQIEELVEDYTERLFSKLADKLKLKTGDTGPFEQKEIENLQARWTEFLYSWQDRQERREETEQDLPF